MMEAFSLGNGHYADAYAVGHHKSSAKRAVAMAKAILEAKISKLEDGCPILATMAIYRNNREVYWKSN